MPIILFLLLLLVYVAHGFTVHQQPCWPLGPAPRAQTKLVIISACCMYRSHLFQSPRGNEKVKGSKGRIVRIYDATKRWLLSRRRPQRRFTVYVLECEHEKYYVGYTRNLRRRMRQHLSTRGGSKWTRIYKPVGMVTEYRRVPADYYLGKEAQVTAELMLKHGVNNVRGAMFTETRLYTRSDIQALTGFLGHFNNLDYKKLKARLQQELEPAAKTKSRRKRKRKRKFKKSDRCFRCGELGHWANECLKDGDWNLTSAQQEIQ